MSSDSSLPPPPPGPLPIEPGTLNPTTPSTAGGFARALVTSFTFIFKRPPLKFFRPVKISTYGTIQIIAKQANQKISIKFIKSLIQKEGIKKIILNYFIPPFIINSIIGITLFETYNFIENLLKNNHNHHQKWIENDYLIRAFSGFLAGATQSLISTPLDNLKLNLLTTTKGEVFKGWWPLIKSNIFSSRNNKTLIKGWDMISLSILKDSIGFCLFFSIFQIGRDFGQFIATKIDKSIYTLEEGKKKSWTSRFLQASIIIFSGAFAGLGFEIITLPIENFRKTVWKIRLDWINDQKKKNIRFNSIEKIESRFDTFNRLQYKSKILQSTTKQFNNSNKIPTPISILKYKIKQEGIYKTFCLDPYKFRKVSSLVGFRSYLLSPYSIGFFVWAVCNGDLS